MHSKPTLSSTGLFLISVFSKLFHGVYAAEMYVLSLKFNYYIDDQLVNECKEYIFDNLPDMWLDSFTPMVAKCDLQCLKVDDNFRNIQHDAKCRTSYPLMIRDGDTSEKRLREENITYALASVPCFLYVGESSIPGAGRGLFTRVKLPKGIIFGPYRGSIKSAHDLEKKTMRDRRYAVWITRFNELGEDDGFYVDAIDESNSNYLRFVNSARHEEEQNMHMLFFNDALYCITYKEIDVGEELMVWYLIPFEKNSIKIVKNSKHDRGHLAPKKDSHL